MRCIIAGCRSATQPTVKKVPSAACPAMSSSSSSTDASTRLSKLVQRSIGAHGERATTWKYSSTSTVKWCRMPPPACVVTASAERQVERRARPEHERAGAGRDEHSHQVEGVAGVIEIGRQRRAERDIGGAVE